VQWRDRLSVWISSDRAESTLPTLSSFRVWPSRRPCCSPSKHETLVVPELSQGRAISWAAKKWKAFPVPKETHTSVSSFSVCARATARTATSVSTVRMRIFVTIVGSVHGQRATLCGCWLLRSYKEPGLKYPEEVACSRHHLLQ